MTLIRESRLPAVAPALTLESRVILPSIAVTFVLSEPADLSLVRDLLERPQHLRWLVTTAPRPAFSLIPTYEQEPEVAFEYGIITLLTDAREVPGGYECRLEGRSVCRVEALPAGLGPGNPYREVRVRHLVDRPDPLAAAQRETTAIIQAFMTLCDIFGLATSEIWAAPELPVDASGLVYRIASSVAGDLSALKPFLAERCPARRRQMVLRLIVRQVSFAQREGLLARHAEYC